jgi:hypothetical protein
LLVVATTVIATLAFKFPVVRYSVQTPLHGQSENRIQSPSATESTLYGHWVVASASEPKLVKFTDGSQIGLTPGSRMRVLGTNRRGAAINLESGKLELQVAGTSSLTEYWASVGPFSLALGSGRAVVSWDPASELLDLVVQEGFVVISGCQYGTGRSVTADKQLVTRCLGR